MNSSTTQAIEIPEPRGPKEIARVGLGALGVVFGDIGTSPLYTMKECFTGPHGVEPDRIAVLGVLSLVFWALTTIVVVKYISFVMRADNQGEGGILALLALITDPQGNNPKRQGERGWKRRYLLISLGIFGAALLFADGIITPVISVLGALEGLEVATPLFKPYVVPVAAAILSALFLVQRRGTESIGRIFGPVMVVWFATLAILGLPWIVRVPGVLVAVSPLHAARFFATHGLEAFLLLGSIVLCVTGAEALYADMGHFGRRPIRWAWFAVTFPALLLNYFGQGAMLLGRAAGEGENLFYEMAPAALRLPLVAIATAAAIIASQALVSGSFSLAQQAVQLGLSPRLQIVHTSPRAKGQIYVPVVNWLLMAGCLALVFAFRSTSNLAAAYGIAVMATMMITSFLFFSVARQLWGWSRGAAIGICALFLAVELPFLGANLVKIVKGGWVPLTVAALLVTILTTWKRGRGLLTDRNASDALPLDSFLSSLAARPLTRVPGTAVFMSSKAGGTPVVLLHHVKHNQVLHERLVLLTVETAATPLVRNRDRLVVREHAGGVFEMVVRFGFMESPDVPKALQLAVDRELLPKLGPTSYYLGRETLLLGRRSGMVAWRKALFIFMSRNARPATAYFALPPNRVVELGAQVEL